MENIVSLDLLFAGEVIKEGRAVPPAKNYKAETVAKPWLYYYMAIYGKGTSLSTKPFEHSILRGTTFPSPVYLLVAAALLIVALMVKSLALSPV